MVQAVIFDCFGVLYLDHRKSLAMQYPAQADELWEVNRQSDYGFLAQRDYLEAISRLTGMTTHQVEAFIRDEHSFNQQLADYIVTELRPHYRVGLLSNIGRGWISHFFTAEARHQLFDAVVLSGEEGITKPHPRIYELVAARLGVPLGDCVMVDDIELNCAGADAAGMRAVHYTDNVSMIQQVQKLLSE